LGRKPFGTDVNVTAGTVNSRWPLSYLDNGYDDTADAVIPPQ